MKKYILVFLFFIYLNIFILFAQNEVLNSKGFSLNLLVGIRVNPINYAWIRGVLPTNSIALKPSFGAELNIHKIHTAISIRKQYWVMPAFVPRFSLIGFMDDTFLGANYLFRSKKKFKIRAGVDFYWSNGTYEYYDYLSGKKSSVFHRGFSPFVAFPLEWIEIELRPEWVLLNTSGIYEAYHYGINLNYRFAYHLLNKKKA